MRDKEEIHEFLFQNRANVDLLNQRLQYLYGAPSKGCISKASRDKARKKNRKKRK